MWGFLAEDVVTASRILVDVSFGLRCLLTSVVGAFSCKNSLIS